MAAVSNPTISLPTTTSATTTSPSLKGLKKVLTGRRRSSEVPSEGRHRGSIDSITLERSPQIRSTHSSPSRDESSKSGGSSMRKLIPGHEKRERRRQREGELQAAAEIEVRARDPESPPHLPTAVTNRSNSSLLTDGSEDDLRPTLFPRESHVGYLTTSSPLMKTVSGEHTNGDGDGVPNASTDSFPIIIEPGAPRTREPPQRLRPTPEPSPKSMPTIEPLPTLPAPGLIDKADTLRTEEPDNRRSSFNRLRGKSPARKIRDVFSKSGMSPRSSPERSPITSRSDLYMPSSADKVPSISERRLPLSPDRISVTPVKTERTTNGAYSTSDNSVPRLETDLVTPRTPPSAKLVTPMTTVTPPTPVEKSHDPTLPPDQDARSSESDVSATTVSASGDMISHRRVRSASSATHGKSKLSTSMTTPLTPTLEEVKINDRASGARNFTPGGGFFSNWVSAAQNAATTLTNFTAPNRSRSGTSSSDPTKAPNPVDPVQDIADTEEQDPVKKRLAIETIGSGNLDFSHFNITGPDGDESTNQSSADLTSLRGTSDLKHDEAQAKVEDIMAKRAVSAAYEKPNESVLEVQDPVTNLRHSQTFDSINNGGSLTPPNGSIFEGNTGQTKRSNSIRGRVKQRSRGSSVATGQTTIGQMITASTTTLVNPGSASKITGFTPAPKTRNRAFHQQFRSVPDDDSLIEDYSCALQKEILLAGRIYISEGHICFSSNILGWVTTLIISFEEIVSIERENTAMIIPNAIAIQTLHARHTFRSLLSREATFDLMIGIWKVNHPASFQKSVNGKQLVAEQAQQQAADALEAHPASGDATDEDSDGDSDSDEQDDDEDGSAESLIGSNASIAGSEFVDAKSVARKPSGINGGPGPAVSSIATVPSIDAAATPVTAGAPTIVDYPGPASHAPTECIDSSTHYDKIVKDEIIAAPLGKIYSLLYGPQSGTFVRKYLVDECKCRELALEDDKKGLTNESKSRQYSYIKPLGGSIGPKQTKCITTEVLDFFDLEKSVSVTCTTQTPDVPSGSAFSTKTRYCLSWAPGNATRLQMNCTIEWTAKSWLKGPIEKGANDGQQEYGDGLIKALKAALGRSRATTVGSKGAKVSSKRKRKGEKKVKGDKVKNSAGSVSDWGILEPVRPLFEPFTDIVRPIVRTEIVIAILSIMVFTMWFRSPGKTSLGYPGSSLSHAQKFTAYEQLWQHKESELWDWLEDRAGVKKVMLGGQPDNSANIEKSRKQQALARQRAMDGGDMSARLTAAKWSERELQEAVRVTRERLDAMQQVMNERATQHDGM